MKLGRNQLCPWGSGLKFKKCCLTKRPLVTAPSVLNHPGLTVPAIVVNDVLTMASFHRRMILCVNELKLWRILNTTCASLF